MKISLNWINNYIKLYKPTEEVVNNLFRIGYDIESFEKQSEKFKNFVIGKVLDKKKHPNADKLSVCTVDVSDKILNIVCGAPNVDKGQTVCVALEGAIIPNGEFEIKKSKIRGEFSEGMICSAKEMNLGDDHTGIMVLNDKLQAGSLFADYLGLNDSILDISIYANRGDLLSHFGVARELGYIYNDKLHIKDTNIETSSKEKIEDYISVEIDNNENCNRYCGIVVKNIKIKESPEWMRRLLEALGLRSINNVVDITNFVMMECGQPLHAFDYRQINGKKIIIRDFGTSGNFTTLDSKERNMRPDILMICDAEKPVGIAGIMGGENSEIKDDTNTVFIESAFFNPISIRKSSKFLGLQTDSSYRFERGVDMDLVSWACKRAAKLMADLAEGEIVQGFIDNYPKPFEKNNIELRMERLNKISGFTFNKEEVLSMFDKVDIRKKNDKDSTIHFEIPNFRRYDLTQEIDLIEEAVRLKGYENIPLSDYDRIEYDSRDFSNDNWDYLSKLKLYLAGRGFKEIITDSIINEEDARLLNDEYIELLNPFNKDMNALRTNLLVGALETIRYNLNYKISSYKLFEYGNIFKYIDDNGNYYNRIFEKRFISLTLAGNYDYETLNVKERYFNLFDLKGEVQALLEKLNIDNYNINYYNYTDDNLNLLQYDKNGVIFAKFINISSKILRKFDINIPVFYCELDFSELKRLSSGDRTYKEISKFPPVFRDLSILVENNIKVNEIESVIFGAKNNLLKELKLYDIYKPEDAANKVSYTFSLVYSSNEKTLTDSEVNAVQEKIIKNLQNKLKAELRK